VPDRLDVLGVGFDRVDLATAVARILERLDRGARTFVITANPEFVMLARSDDELARIAREADVVVPDVPASRSQPLLPRVPCGGDLVDALVRTRRAPASSWRAPGIAERAADALRAREPRLPSPAASGLPRRADTTARVQALARCPRRVRMPKQERWIARNLASLRACGSPRRRRPDQLGRPEGPRGSSTVSASSGSGGAARALMAAPARAALRRAVLWKRISGR
jgi:N-acetylglucosaminyldiphosphoundecaprenol N-acetyl-beta-D-mannosaminyltransferase